MPWQAMVMTPSLRALSLLILLILCSLAIEAQAIYIIGPYGMSGYYEDYDPPPPPRPRQKCEDVLKLDFTHVPFHQDLGRARNRIGDDLELRNYRFTESEDKVVGVHLVFFGGRSEDVYFRYDEHKHIVIPELVLDEQILALSTAMVIPVLFPNELEVSIVFRSQTNVINSAMAHLKYVIESEDLKANGSAKYDFRP